MYCPKCGSRLFPGDQDYMDSAGVCSYCVTYDSSEDKRFKTAYDRFMEDKKFESLSQGDRRKRERKINL